VRGPDTSCVFAVLLIGSAQIDDGGSGEVQPCCPTGIKACRMRGWFALNAHRTRGAEHGESMNRTSPKLVLKGGLKGGGLDPIIVASRSHGCCIDSCRTERPTTVLVYASRVAMTVDGGTLSVRQLKDACFVAGATHRRRGGLAPRPESLHVLQHQVPSRPAGSALLPCRVVH
jgi:hypothetical protein